MCRLVAIEFFIDDVVASSTALVMVDPRGVVLPTEDNTARVFRHGEPVLIGVVGTPVVDLSDTVGLLGDDAT